MAINPSDIGTALVALGGMIVTTRRSIDVETFLVQTPLHQTFRNMALRCHQKTKRGVVMKKVLSGTVLFGLLSAFLLPSSAVYGQEKAINLRFAHFMPSTCDQVALAMEVQ
jgi:hypothetical protein